MKRKILSFVLAVVAVTILGCACALTACSDRGFYVKDGTLTVTSDAAFPQNDLSKEEIVEVHTVVFDKSVTEIHRNAFTDFVNITRVTLPDGLKTVGGDAFRNCGNLTEIRIPEGVTEINYGAFYGCTKLAAVNVPESVTALGGNAFYNTAFYNDESNWQNGGLYSGACLINVNKNYSGKFTVRRGTKLIANAAFKNCTALTETEIADGVTVIGHSAFDRCLNLSRITIPLSVNKIGNYAFNNCDSLTEFRFDGTIEQWNAVEKAESWDNADFAYTVYCSDGEITKDIPTEDGGE